MTAPKKINLEELMDLDRALCRWLLPRLKEFKRRNGWKKYGGHPHGMTHAEYQEILGKIIEACELNIAPLRPKYNMKREFEETMKINEGFRLLGEHLGSLWF